MNEYRVYHSARFDKELNKFDIDFQRRVDKIEDQLVENPYTGDPLGVRWFREKRYDKYRIYYLIYQKNFLKNRLPSGWSLIGDFSDSEIFWMLKKSTPY